MVVENLGSNPRGGNSMATTRVPGSAPRRQDDPASASSAATSRISMLVLALKGRLNRFIKQARRAAACSSPPAAT
jgi:hypothetical protein